MSDTTIPAPGFPTPEAMPGAAPAPGGMTSPLPKSRNPIVVWLLLPIVTLGIYNLVWYYKINKDTQFNPRTSVDPAKALLTLMFGGIVIIPPFVSIKRTGDRIAAAQRAAGLAPTCNGVVGLLLMFVFHLGQLYYQAEMNKVVAAYPGATAGTPVPLRAA